MNQTERMYRLMNNNNFTSITLAGNSSALYELFVRNCSIHELPGWLALLPNLSRLVASSNPIESLRSLDSVSCVANNDVESKCFPALVTFDVSYSLAGGLLPRALGGQYLESNAQLSIKPLTILTLKYCRFTGTMPSNYVHLKQLNLVDITHNPFLHVGDGFLTRMPIDTNHATSFADGSYRCNNLVPTSFVLLADPSFFYYKHCSCSPEFYGEPPGCVPCVPFATCQGSNELQWHAGTYPVCDTPSCLDGNATLLGISHCPGGNLRCNDGAFVPGVGVVSSGELCQPGFTGELCTKCVQTDDVCYFPTSHGDCIPYEDDKYGPLRSAPIFTTWFLVQVFLHVNSKHQVEMRLLIFYCTWLFTISTNYPVWLLSAFLAVLGINSTSVSSSSSEQPRAIFNYGLSYTCYLPFLRGAAPAWRLALELLAPFFLFSVVFLVQRLITVIGTSRCRCCARQGPVIPAVYSYRLPALMLNTCFWPMIYKCIAVFVTVPNQAVDLSTIDTGRTYVKSMPWLATNTAEYDSLLAIAIAGILLYSILQLSLPAFYACASPAVREIWFEYLNEAALKVEYVGNLSNSAIFEVCHPTTTTKRTMTTMKTMKTMTTMITLPIDWRVCHRLCRSYAQPPLRSC